MDGDVGELRDEYLFDMARVCSIDARSLDALRVFDFFTYILHIDMWREHEAELLERGMLNA